MIRFYRRHSLSLVLTLGGLLICVAALWLPEGKWFDLVSQTGGGMSVAGLVNFMAGPLRETNRPELPPKKSRARKGSGRPRSGPPRV